MAGLGRIGAERAGMRADGGTGMGEKKRNRQRERERENEWNELAGACRSRGELVEGATDRQTETETAMVIAGFM